MYELAPCDHADEAGRLHAKAPEYPCSQRQASLCGYCLSAQVCEHLACIELCPGMSLHRTYEPPGDKSTWP